jgi:hypothetical protein
MSSPSDSNDTQATETKPDIGQLQADIEQTRQELGETVDALTAKLDVKSRARARLSNTKERAVVQLRGVQAKATTDEGKPAPAVLAGAGVLAAVVVLATTLAVWRKRR